MQNLYNYFNNLPPYLEIAIVALIPLLIIITIIFVLSKTTRWFKWNEESVEMLRSKNKED